ncbi:serine protease [Streptacidiphilus sp. EB129]|uniref:trypsin-like serine peptidase n=1 Tax=Streptacidiphilus sp. EB129 TaxID=3156262 RepID=UPI00351493E3
MVSSALIGIGTAVAVAVSALAPGASAEVRTAVGSQTAAAAPAPTAPGAVAPKVTTGLSQGLSSAAVDQYWTPQRMASATSEDPTSTKVTGRGLAPHTTIAQSYPNGRPSIGVIFYAGQDMRNHYCTASVVHSPGRDMILLAAHCRPGRWMAFVPGYRSGAKTQPYGVWSVQSVYTDSHFSGTGSGTDYDYAFAKVSKDRWGRQIENVTGGNTLTRTPSYYNWAGVTGYPKASALPADRAITCWNHTAKVPGYSQMSFLCTGYYGGTSGSPFLIHLDNRTNTGQVIGLIGGLDAGGPNSWTSYSPIFDNKIFYLYNYAIHH